MLHDRRGDPDPLIAAWLADNEAGRKKTSGPANMLARWNQASPALQTALAKPLASRLDTFCQLRYRALAGPARIPDPARADEHVRALPSLLWPGWALRLIPPGGFDFLRYRSGLGVMLAVASAGADSYRTAQELLGLQPVHGNRFASFTARLRKHQVLEPVAAAICQLARKLDQHGTPIDYARRRRRFSRAQLDVTSWRRQRHLLTHPDTRAHRRHLGRADLPAAPVEEHLARLRLIELLTGTHPCYLPGPLRLPGRRGPGYAEFVFTLPEPMAGFLHQRASSLLRHAGISEPVTWEPPFGWVTGITWPGARHPAPQPPAGTSAQVASRPEAPGTDRLRALTAQGFGPRKIAWITGCSEPTIRQLLTDAGLRQAPNRPGGDRDVRPVLESLAQSRSKNASHAP